MIPNKTNTLLARHAVEWSLGQHRAVINMFRGRRHIIICIAAILFAVAWLAKQPREPMCDGRSLTQWMEALGSANEDAEAHAFAAIERIGTNGLPFILPRLATRDSAWQFQVLALVQRAPFLQIHFTAPNERRQQAKIALILSGGESMQASISDLGRLSRDKDPGVRLTAVELLSGFPVNDTSPLSALKAAQADPDPRVRAAAVEAVGLRRAVGESRLKLGTR